MTPNKKCVNMNTDRLLDLNQAEESSDSRDTVCVCVCVMYSKSDVFVVVFSRRGNVVSDPLSKICVRRVPDVLITPSMHCCWACFYQRVRQQICRYFISLNHEGKDSD